MEDKTPQEALKEILDIDYRVKELSKLINKGKYKLILLRDYEKKRAQQIADKFKFKGGCGKENLSFGFCCGDNGVLCPTCDKIQEVNKEIQNE